MRLSTTEKGYGIISITLHWITAVLVIGLFSSGLYMTALDYMHPWYREAPHLHKSFGLVLFALLVFRTVWAMANKKPEPEDMPRWERRTASVVQKLLYLLLFVVAISGYLIAAADGKPIEVFNWFGVPALVTGIEHQEDVAGSAHYFLAATLVCLAGLHAAAALKHHFIDRDATLLRMLGRYKTKDVS